MIFSFRCLLYEWLNMVCLYLYAYLNDTSIWDVDEIYEIPLFGRMRYIIDTSICDEKMILDIAIYDRKGSETSLYGIWAHTPFEEFEICTDSGNQRIESCDFGNH